MVIFIIRGIFGIKKEFRKDGYRNLRIRINIKNKKLSYLRFFFRRFLNLRFILKYILAKLYDCYLYKFEFFNNL